MRHIHAIAAIILGIALPICTGAAEQVSSSTGPLELILTDAQTYQQTDNYRIPETSELVAFEAFLLEVLMAHESALSTVSDDRLQSKADALGWIVEQVTEMIGDRLTGITIVREKDDRREGRGIYFLADSNGNLRPTVIQCPHARSDTYTGLIGLAAFRNGAGAAFFSSTMRRNAPVLEVSLSASEDAVISDAGTAQPGDESEDDPDSEATGDEAPEDYGVADPAHQTQSFFHSAHKSWIRRHPASLVIQLHGFRQEKDNPGRQFDVIVSDGKKTTAATALLKQSRHIFSTCLAGYRIGLFGHDTSLFGAFSNSQGQYINRYSSGTFLHLEIERAFREKIIHQPAVSGQFIQCLHHLIQAHEKM